MEILWFVVLLSFKHFLADFVLQLDYMAVEKGTYLKRGGIHHAMIHGLLTWWALFLFVSPITAFFLSVLDALVHYHIDWAKVNLSSQYNNQDSEYWIYFGLDQLLHYLTYVCIIAIIITI